MRTRDPHPIAVAVDGTPGCAGALRRAVHEASARGTRLHLVHVMPNYVSTSAVFVTPADLELVGKEVLDDARSQVRQLADGLRVTATLATGPRVEEILVAAAGVDAQLIVVGQETRRGVDRMLGGTTTAGVVAHARCAVACVPAEWPSAETLHHRVVVGLKTPDHADEVLAYAFAEASEQGAALSVVHTWHLPDPYRDRIEQRTSELAWRAAGTELVENAVARWRLRFPEVQVDIRVVHAEPALALLEAAHESDQLVLLRAHRQGLVRHHLGPVTRALLHASPVPLDVVPARPLLHRHGSLEEEAGVDVAPSSAMVSGHT